MTLRPNLAILLAAMLAVSCVQQHRRSAQLAGVLETSARLTTVQTVSGPVAGYIDDGVYIYKGIPYAKAERFAPAVDPDPWTDVRPSRAYGPTAPLRVNIWTGGINDGKKRPVMVWLHGGGFREGSGQELICYDGSNLARDHDVVVVSLNHRLNVLGFLDLSNLLTPKYSRRVGAATVANLGLNPSKIEDIATVPYDRLLAAYDAALKQIGDEAKEDGAFPTNILDSLLFGQVPIVDGEIIPAQPGTPEALAISKDVPTIIGTVYHEFTRDQEDPIFKPLAVQQASDRTVAGCAPVYFYQFTWETPVLDGAMGSTHCIEIPFVFDNVLLHRTFTGGEDDAIELGHRVSRLWTSFAKTGKPESEGIPTWETYPKTLIINTKSELK